MQLFRLTLITLLLGGASLCTAQEPKATPQDPQTSASTKEAEEPKSEMTLALEELKKRGEGVLTVAGKNSDKSKQPEKKITSGVINGKAIELIQPAYPAIARASHASGQVAVLVLVDKAGKVIAAEVLSGHPLLQGAAYKAAKASRFTPTLIDGKPTHVMGELIYNFVPQ